MHAHDAHIETITGWRKLPNGSDLFLKHGIPTAVSRARPDLSIPDDQIAKEITIMSGLPVTFGAWVWNEKESEFISRVTVLPQGLKIVIGRLGQRGVRPGLQDSAQALWPVS